QKLSRRCHTPVETSEDTLRQLRAVIPGQTAPLRQQATCRDTPTRTVNPPPSSVIKSAVSFERPLRSTHSTLAPSRANCTAVALPLPNPGPRLRPGHDRNLVAKS